MRRALRHFGIVLAALAVLAMPIASMAMSNDDLYHTSPHEEGSPPMLDALVLRPLGLMALAFGAVLWVPAQGITLLTRPTDSAMPTKVLIWGPMKYTFGDPLGSH